MKRTQYMITGLALTGLMAFSGCKSTGADIDVPKKGPADLDYEADGAKAVNIPIKNLRDARFCELFFIRVKGDQNELNVYNPTGLNGMEKTKDSCPDELLSKLDIEGLIKHYKLDGIYFNQPRHWIMDEMLIPVGAVRELDGMDYYWMASSHMPANIEMKPGFLTYKRCPVERKSTFTFKAGKEVFLLDDPDGKVWVMKAYRDSYGQSYETLKDLGKRYKKLPEGFSTRVKVLEKDLVLKPTGGVATVMQDEFENTYDYLGDGCSNYIP
ncbi:hypothetical protein PDESU_01011 [Pontiella desulfatans]|uniref:Uncharacterized protein n=1 Tax=Pontiella desulfatans TaxID=2750659 RepID=A0A6C2TXL5_PONDE|nr:hypothetical protein [Pontiella desulfatans]VGO12458.1 hypothetical protein PDESU_01011 [Pontiella desulfatans]